DAETNRQRHDGCRRSIGKCRVGRNWNMRTEKESDDGDEDGDYGSGDMVQRQGIIGCCRSRNYVL
ncbi:unnamed protein product, partial [Linum tenue]